MQFYDPRRTQVRELQNAMTMIDKIRSNRWRLNPIHKPWRRIWDRKAIKAAAQDREEEAAAEEMTATTMKIRPAVLILTR